MTVGRQQTTNRRQFRHKRGRHHDLVNCRSHLAGKIRALTAAQWERLFYRIDILVRHGDDSQERFPVWTVVMIVALPRWQVVCR